MFIVDVANRAFIRNHFSWNPNHHAIFGDIVSDDAVGTDGGVVADRDLPKDLCAGADINVIAYHWNTRSFPPPADANRDLLRQVAIFANNYLFIDNNSTLVPHVETRTDLGFVGDADTKADLLVTVDELGAWKEQNTCDGI